MAVVGLTGQPLGPTQPLINNPTGRGSGITGTGVAASQDIISPGSNTTQGTTLVLIVATSGFEVSSLTDSKGNVWQVDKFKRNGAVAAVSICSCYLATALTTADTITINYAGSAGRRQYEMWEVVGLASSSYLDQSSTNSGSGTAVDAGVTGTTTLPNEIVFAAFAIAFAETTFTPGGSYTALTRVSQSSLTLDAEQLIVSATGAQHATGTFSPSSNTWAAVSVTYKSAGAAEAPVNTTPPVASGTVQVGSIVSSTSGVWTNSPTSYAYQWQRSSDGSTGWANIAAATAASYTLAAADQAKYVRCAVTASNATGSATANSNVLGPVAAAAPAPTPAPQTVGHVCYLDLNNPTAATRNYVDISKYVRTFDVQSGKQHELDRIEGGTLALTLNSVDRRFDPTYTAGPYYPYLKPIRNIKWGIVVAGVIYWQFDGYVDRWPQHPRGRSYCEVMLTASDGFEQLKSMELISARACVTTVQGGNRDITYCSQGVGFEGNSFSVTYIQQSGADKAATIVVDGLDITVNLATDHSGSPHSTANGIISRVNKDPIASGLVIASLPAGQTGQGILNPMSTIYLTGGTYVEELGGQRIEDILDAGGYPASRRRIDDGVSLVQAQDFPLDGSSDVLTHAQEVADSELGWFFMDRNGNATFFDRRHFTSSPYTTSQMTLVDHSDNPSGGAEQYMTMVADFDKDLLYNKWIVTRTNGQPQTGEDATSEGQYFKRKNSKSALYTSDGESLAAAQYLTQIYKQPALRFEPLQMRPGVDIPFWTALAARDLGDRLTVVWQPPGGGPPISQQVNLAHRHIYGGPGPMATVIFEYQVLPVAAFPPSNVWTLDDATLGKLDANVLTF